MRTLTPGEEIYMKPEPRFKVAVSSRSEAMSLDYGVR